MVPLADRYLTSRSASDAALTTVAKDVRSDLGRVAKAHMELAQRLDEFAAHVDTIAAETRQTRSAAQSIEVRTTALEQRLNAVRLLLVVTLGVAILAVVLLGILLTRSQ